MPINIRDFCRKNIKPFVKNWRGLYSGRRGAASILSQLTGSPIAASQLLRHSNISTTMTDYIKTDRSTLASGLKLLEDKLAE